MQKTITQDMYEQVCGRIANLGSEINKYTVQVSDSQQDLTISAMLGITSTVIEIMREMGFILVSVYVIDSKPVALFIYGDNE